MNRFAALCVLAALFNANAAKNWPTEEQIPIDPSKTTLQSSEEQSIPVCRLPNDAISLILPTSKPARTYIVPGDFVGFGFETAFLNNYAVGTFSENLVNSVAQRVSERLTIRTGGTSGDLLLFEPGLKEDKVCLAGDCPVGSGATYLIGNSYFQGFRKFKNQKFSFQVPLGPKLNFSGSLTYVSRAYSMLGADRVAGIALGNEPDLYARQHGVRYSVRDYVNAAVRMQKAIIERLKLSGEAAKIFEASDLAGYGNFDLPSIFRKGVDRKGYTKFAASHYYQLNSSPRKFDPIVEQRVLMNHTAIKAKFNTGYLAAKEYIEAHHHHVDYIISESGSSLAGPPRYFQDAFGATLWMLDFNLYAMSVGVKRVANTQRPATNHSLWVPDDSANRPEYGREYSPGPQVRAPYFALPMVADFIGHDAGAVVEVLSDDLISGYVIYDPETWKVKRMVLINLRYWSIDQKTKRRTTTFGIPVGFDRPPSITLQRLHAEAGARAQGYDVQGEDGQITWAGETWSYELDNGNGHYTGTPRRESVSVCGGTAIVEVPDSGEPVSICGGTAIVEVPDSEAVLLTFT